MTHNENTPVAIAWDARIADQLDELSIDYVGETETAPLVIERIKRYGFVRLTGLSNSFDREIAARKLQDFSQKLGVLVPQSPRSEKVEDVRDFSDVEEKDERGYRSRGELTPHSDPPTIIALHCLHEARSGGESALVNVRAIHDRIKERDAGLLKTLYTDFPAWRVAGQRGEDKAKADGENKIPTTNRPQVPVVGENDSLPAKADCNLRLPGRIAKRFFTCPRGRELLHFSKKNARQPKVAKVSAPAKADGENKIPTTNRPQVPVVGENDGLPAKADGENKISTTNRPQVPVVGENDSLPAGPAARGRPVFASLGETISCVIYRPFIERSAAAQNTPLSPIQVEALDIFEHYATDPELALNFSLSAGDTLLIHNRSVLHARRDYQDWPEAHRRRHLLRVWIDAPENFPVASCHELGDLFAKDQS